MENLVTPNIKKHISSAANVSIGAGESFVGKANGKLMMGIGFGPLLLNALSWIVGGAGKVLKSDKLANASGGIKGFNEGLTTKGIAEFAGDTVVGKGVSKGMKGMFGGIGELFGGLDKNGSIFNWFRDSHYKDVGINQKVFNDMLGKFETSLIKKKDGTKLLSDAAHTDLVGHIQTLRNELVNAKDATALKAAKDAINSGFDSIKNYLGDLVQAGGADAKAASSLASNLNSDLVPRHTTLLRNIESDLGNNLKEMVQKVPDRLGKMTTHDLIFQGTNALMVADEGYKMVKDFRSNMKVMKSMYQDMTGEAKVSTWKILFSKDVPEPVKMLRGQYMRRNLFANIFNFGGFAAGQVLFNRGHKMGWGIGKTMGLGLLPGIGTSIATGFIFNPVTAAETYATIAQAQASGVQVPAESYAQLFAGFSPTIAKTGRIGGSKIEDLALVCAEQQVDLGTALKMFDEARLGKNFASNLSPTTAALTQQAMSGVDMNDRQPTAAMLAQQAMQNLQLNSHSGQQVVRGQHTQQYLNSKSQGPRQLV